MISKFQLCCLSVIIMFCMFEYSSAIRCYKCKGDEECDFTKRQIYIDNCTWATKCWGARIGDNFIRSCADDRCDIQIGLGGYIESKCCYDDLCNNDSFFFPNTGINKFSIKFEVMLVLGIVILFLIKRYVLH
ncbi:unnamed protein product [Brachionus calyciflorus]|uniref:Uncharacterized protein n=1 Tax=Brachionus calyciflorus TaxID=104777 RepID=A0A814FRL4_9BILA|nr:unnamed protein product [Brachionus calyciflorus]